MNELAHEMQSGSVARLEDIFAPDKYTYPRPAEGTLEPVLRSLGAEITSESTVPVAPTGSFEALIRGTRYHFRMRDSILALGQLAWSVARLSAMIGSPGDAVTLAAALAKLHDSVQKLDVDNGEVCAYLAIGQAISADARSSYPGLDAIAEAAATGKSWCRGRCRLHAGEAGDGETLAATLAALAAKNAVKRDDDGKWRVVV
jgi:hypothetical protein